MVNDKNGGGAHEDYLNAPDTAGRPMAVMSLIMVFLVIAAVALALFVGGRWFYNEVVKGDDTSQVATEDSETTENSSEDANGSTSDNESGDDSDASTSGSEGNDTSGSNDENTTEGQGGTNSEGSSEDSNGGDSSATNSTNTDDDATTGEQNAATTAVTGPADTEEVPNTGPQSLLAVFIGATIIGSFAHRKWLVNKL